MTREEILSMEPGRELDALAAEKVMGWRDILRTRHGSYVGKPNIDHVLIDECPKYSTDIAAAWEVRGKMEELGWISKDQITWMGWGDENKHPYGYSIWFENWSRLEIN